VLSFVSIVIQNQRIKFGALESVLETDAFIMVECNSERRHLDIVADANGDGDHVDADGDDDTGGWLLRLDEPESILKYYRMDKADDEVPPKR